MPLTNIRVFIADDHEMVIKGLSEFINAAPDMRVVGTAGNGDELVKNLEKLHTEVDVALVDIGMEKMDGLAATSKIKEVYKNIKVLIITGLRGRNYAAESIRNNADGFISKSRSLREISEAIRRIMGGEMVYMPDPSDPVLPPEPPKKLPELSPMEQRVLCMIVDGMSSKEISDTLKMSQPNVERFRRNVMGKLDAKNTADMVRIAVEYGLCRGSSAA